MKLISRKKYTYAYECCLIHDWVTRKSGGSGSGSGAGGLNFTGFCVCCFRIRSTEDGLNCLFCKWGCFGGRGGGSISNSEVTIIRFSCLEFCSDNESFWFVEQLKKRQNMCVQLLCWVCCCYLTKQLWTYQWITVE